MESRLIFLDLKERRKILKVRESNFTWRQILASLTFPLYPQVVGGGKILAQLTH